MRTINISLCAKCINEQVSLFTISTLPFELNAPCVPGILPIRKPKKCRTFQIPIFKKGWTFPMKRREGILGDSTRRGNAQGQIGKTVFTIDLRRGEGLKLNFLLISLEKRQTLEKVSLFRAHFSCDRDKQ
jgi:hypothetical protein